MFKPIKKIDVFFNLFKLKLYSNDEMKLKQNYKLLSFRSRRDILRHSNRSTLT